MIILRSRVKYCGLWFVLSVLLIQGSFAQSKTTDSLFTIVKSAKNDTFYLDAVSGLANEFYLFSPDSAYTFLEKGLKYCDSVLKRSIDRSEGESVAVLRRKAGFLNDIAFLSERQGNLAKAIDFYEKCISINKRTNDRVSAAATFNNMGVLYKNIGDLKMAESYFLKSMEQHGNLKDSFGLSILLNNLGDIYFKQKNYATSLDFYNKSRKINSLLEGVEKTSAATCLGIGKISFVNKDYESAGKEFNLAVSLQQKVNDKQGLANSYLNLSLLSEALNDKSKAYDYALNAFNIGKELGYPDKIRDAALLLFKILNGNKKYKEAIEMHLIYTQMKDSINGEETRKRAIQQRYQSEFKERELLLKEEQIKKDIINKEHEKKLALIRNVFIGGFIMMIIIALVIYQNYRGKKRANLIISEQKKLVEEKQKEILDSIHYAKRIQSSLLPTENYIEKNLQKLNNDK